MKFGVYVHIPYCLQQCPYCDFATVKWDHPVKREDYTDILLQEIRTRNQAVPYKSISTLYFGGGTPSLAGPKNIAAVIQELKQYFDCSRIEEITLEINPGTLSESDLNLYMQAGVTRYSVGVQTFNPVSLKTIGREHTAEDTHKTLGLLNSYNVTYTADLLFALPDQTIEDLYYDLSRFAEYSPPHISAYCLTVPDNSSMSKNRPSDEIQAKMFYIVEDELSKLGLKRYEISNYSLPGKEAQHNSLYWNGQPYWGLGMSAHSYFLEGSYGTRFWNPPTITSYQKQISENLPVTRISLALPSAQVENLTVTQALTDFCHTRLRKRAGFNEEQLSLNFSPGVIKEVLTRLNRLKEAGLVESSAQRDWKISQTSLVLSEQVFQEMTFLPSDLN